MSRDEQAHATRPRTARDQASLPGAWAAALIAILAALIAGSLARPKAETADGAAPPGASRLAEVEQDEVGAALETVAAPPEQVARFRGQEACRRKLAWVTIAGLPNRPAGRIRLQSGKYLSPAFDLTDVPVRVALPYPAPYPTGHGTISIVGTTSDAVVALTPSWQVAANQGVQSREVSWTPAGGCPPANPASD